MTTISPRPPLCGSLGQPLRACPPLPQVLLPLLIDRTDHVLPKPDIFRCRLQPAPSAAATRRVGPFKRLLNLHHNQRLV